MADKLNEMIIELIKPRPLTKISFLASSDESTNRKSSNENLSDVAFSHSMKPMAMIVHLNKSHG